MIFCACFTTVKWGWRDFINFAYPRKQRYAPCRILHIFLYVDAHIFLKFPVPSEVCGWKYMHRTLKTSGAPRDRNTRVTCSLFDGPWRDVFVSTHAHLVGMPGPYAKYSSGQITWRGMYQWTGEGSEGVAVSCWRQGMRERVLLSVQKQSYSITDIFFWLL